MQQANDVIDRLNTAVGGRYRIERELGRGGMATVYLAEDLRHERRVALKVLKPELAAVVGAERFLAEIKTTAGLQHPHILPLHDSGEAGGFLFYVMPYVEGETLRERLDRDRQLPVDEALRIAVAVANALQAAHDSGVVHRDIKPGNILLGRGEPLVADFGIALAVSTAGGGRLTETGLSMGTPYYMSPEQASADREATPASDVYSLGCVLYEMLVGEPPHTGSSAQAVLAKILMDAAPAPTRARASIPPNVDAAIRRSLEKLPADRFATAEEMVRALRDPSFRHGEPANAPTAGGVMRWKRVSGAAAALSAGLAVALVWALLRPGPPPAVARFHTPFDAGQLPATLSFMDLTADGTALVYTGERGGLMMRRWSDLEATPIRGGETASFPVLSPDDAQVAFIDGQSLRVVQLGGGPARQLAPSISYAWDWDDDGFVYATAALPSVIVRVPVDGGGAVDTVTTFSEGEAAHLFFTLLPGGRMAVFESAHDLTGEGSEVWALDLDSRERRFLTAGHTPRYAGGQLFFVTADGVLMAQRIDARGAELSGRPVPVAEELAMSIGVSHYAVSESGTLVYREGGSTGSGLHEPVWVTRSGQATPVDPSWSLTINPAVASGLRISPDGARVASTQSTGEGFDIWLKQLPDGPLERLTSDAAYEGAPFWSPDGRSVAYSADNYQSLAQRRADGAGPPTPLLSRVGTGGAIAGDWSSDGEWIVFQRSVGSGGVPVGAHDIMGFRPGLDTVAVPLVASANFAEWQPRLSPNGRWLAYASDQTGRMEVYVRPFPNVDSTRVTVSRAGGGAPVWARDGTELFFLDEAGGLVAARVEAGDAFRVLDTQVLFTVGPPLILGQNMLGMYDVAPDGARFLMLRLAGGGGGSGADRRFVLVQNVFEEIRAREEG